VKVAYPDLFGDNPECHPSFLFRDEVTVNQAYRFSQPVRRHSASADVDVT
jgi:hypothetical protein